MEQLWNDGWPSLTIVKKINVRGNRYGINQISVEYVLLSQTDFTYTFENFGFRFKLNNPKLCMISS